MKNQVLFSSKDKSKRLKCRLLQLLFGALRVDIVLALLSKSISCCQIISHVICCILIDFVLNYETSKEWRLCL